MSKTSLPTDIDRALAEAERIENVECGFPACSRTGHDSNAPKSDWNHQMCVDHFDNGCVYLEINFASRHGLVGYVDMGATGEMTSAEFRAMAETYEKFPDLLRMYADRMDAIGRIAAGLAGTKSLTFSELGDIAGTVGLAPSTLVRFVEQMASA